MVVTDLELLFEGNNIKMSVSLKLCELAQNAPNYSLRCRYLPRNGYIVKVTTNDLDLLLHVQKSETLVSRKQ